MATSNFYHTDANKIYAVLMNYETPILDDDGNETDETEIVSPDKWECDDLFSNLIDEFNKLESFSQHGEGNSRGHFSETVIGIVGESIILLGMEIQVNLLCVIRSGYYEGANLDYNLNFTLYTNWSEEFSNIDDLVDAFIDSASNKGMAKIQSKNLYKWLEKTENKLRNDVENIYQMFSTPLKVVARFSNGETIYEKVS